MENNRIWFCVLTLNVINNSIRINHVRVCVCGGGGEGEGCVCAIDFTISPHGNHWEC